jgi:hypothetical protein
MSDNIRRAITLLEAELADLEAQIDLDGPFSRDLGMRVDGLLESIAILTAIVHRVTQVPA